MLLRDRTWLRGFLALDARADTTALTSDIERQEDTVLRALELLDTEPGVVLADEVGMGKTYEALGVVAARMRQSPEAKTLILTPGPDLNLKWSKEISAFCDAQRPMFKGFEGKFATATSLAGLIEQADKHAIVVAPVSIFAGSRSTADLAYLLSAWAEIRGLAGNQVAAIFNRYREGIAGRVDLRATKFLESVPWTRIEPILKAAIREQKGDTSLNELLKNWDYDGFKDTRYVDRALADLRFRLVARLLPTFDLLVVDEAHKLKNAESVRATGVRTVMGGRFEKALFLTATPFQLTVSELGEIFALFARAKSAPDDLEERAEKLLGDVADYTRAYADFERMWAATDPVAAADFGVWFDADPGLVKDPDDPTLRVLVSHVRRLVELKREKIEPGFRRWMIRTLREEKRVYRRSEKVRLRPRGGRGVPFLLYERFIAELFRSKSRTHKAAVQINLVSSYSAARSGALLTPEIREDLAEEPELYRRLCQKVVHELQDTRGGHPKVAWVVDSSLAAARAGEKTLIFCARVDTLRELKREIESAWNDGMLESWQSLYPGASPDDIFGEVSEGVRVRGRHARIQVRFQRGLDALFLALRERFIPTLLDASEFALENLDRVVERANAILSRQWVTRTHAERMDWSLAKRCVEQATALLLQEDGLAGDVDAEVMRRLSASEFVTLGYDLEADDLEAPTSGTETPTWTIRREDAELVVPPVHLWSHLKGPMFDVPADLRVRTVERLASYLVSRYVSFLPDLLAFARSEGADIEEIESRALLPVIDRFWTTAAGRPWTDLLKRFLVYAGQLPDVRKKEVLDDVVLAGAIVRHTVDGESRERLREAFNTPLYPMILVANEVMQEGLDLHHHCRRVIHHDLAWNPAQLEQRVGRVDRLGSLVQQMRRKAPDTKLEISLPLVANTIDERLERTVRMRERWLEFLLGAAPKIEEYGLADEAPAPLPLGLADALKIELGPRARP